MIMSHAMIGWGLWLLATAVIFGTATPFLLRCQRETETTAPEVPWNGARMSQFYAVHHRAYDQIDFGPFNTVKEFEDWYEEVGRRIGFSGGLRHMHNPWMSDPRDAWYTDPMIPKNELFGRDVISGSDLDPTIPRRMVRFCADCRDRLPRDYDEKELYCERCIAREAEWTTYYEEYEND